MTSLARRAIPVFFQGGGFEHRKASERPPAFTNASWNIRVRGVKRPLLGSVFSVFNKPKDNAQQECICSGRQLWRTKNSLWCTAVDVGE